MGELMPGHVHGAKVDGEHPRLLPLQKAQADLGENGVGHKSPVRLVDPVPASPGYIAGETFADVPPRQPLGPLAGLPDNGLERRRIDHIGRAAVERAFPDRLEPPAPDAEVRGDHESPDFLHRPGDVPAHDADRDLVLGEDVPKGLGPAKRGSSRGQ